MGMTINLTKLKVRPTIAGPEIEQDLTMTVAEAIYANCSSLAEMKFALKLSEAKGDIEISEAEAGYIRKALASFKFWAQLPIIEQLDRKEVLKRNSNSI